eukprot:TRINITY_DN1833_c0_g1_i1.p1 TRINITY_DN1833_c0_g1~~TRINITY_DN1833_c0_g1_i1.p1  ORF type:complete len:273 (+),score=42.49 TRINITY_DN1833_c0_g1_i1:86-904(+)
MDDSEKAYLILQACIGATAVLTGVGAIKLLSKIRLKRRVLNNQQREQERLEQNAYWDAYLDHAFRAHDFGARQRRLTNERMQREFQESRYFGYTRAYGNVNDPYSNRYVWTSYSRSNQTFTNTSKARMDRERWESWQQWKSRTGRSSYTSSDDYYHNFSQHYQQEHQYQYQQQQYQQQRQQRQRQSSSSSSYSSSSSTSSSANSLNTARSTLGLAISERLTEQSIKKAFRAKAMVLHPDRPTGNANQFRHAYMAYQLLLQSVKPNTVARASS